MDERETIYKFVCMTDEIQKRYKPLDWLDMTLWVEESKGSITFGNNAKCQSELKFFNECVQIKEFIKSLGYDAELIMFPSDKDCKYPEATINFDFYGDD